MGRLAYSISSQNKTEDLKVDNKYYLKTEINDKIIKQTLESPNSKLVNWVCDTSEQGIHDALISLGWKPPVNEDYKTMLRYTFDENIDPELEPDGEWVPWARVEYKIEKLKDALSKSIAREEEMEAELVKLQERTKKLESAL